jgi:hypothetical protein
MQFGNFYHLSSCIFHHPKDNSSDLLSSLRFISLWDLSKRCWLDWNTWAHGLPEYSFYIEGGRCQFGSVCEFLHLKGTWSTTEVCILLPLSK